MDYLCGERGFPYCFPTRGLCLPGLWAHCQVSNLEDPQKFEKCERTVFRTRGLVGCGSKIFVDIAAPRNVLLVGVGLIEWE